MATGPKKITIVGGGASGTLLAVNLLKNAGDAEVEINLVERRERIGRGVAFSTDRDSHLLNVPAGRMGAFPDDTDHFYKWIIENGHSFDSHDFVPRRIFGQYLREVFTETAEKRPPNVTLNLIDDVAVDMSVNKDSAEVILRSGEILQSHRVVLAFGNFLPPHPSVEDQKFVTSAKYFRDPWSSQMYDAIKPDDSIFIVGTGLSMVDVALHFHKAGHGGKIYAISTRGLLPTRHELGYTYPAFAEELKQMTRVTDMLKAVRRHIENAEADSSNWRAVIDSLRPATQELWLNLPLAEKRYFMQHLSRYWNVARHRMPAEAGDILDEMLADGRLEILKGRLKDIKYESGKFNIVYATIDEEHRVTADTLVNCIGSESNFSRIDSQFVANLVER
ncbi:MAG TPA: FAD/NAD(P)-binding protein, partial [Pyrinomonadaceae bacterium]|nr:FAD/NAD(P)-binding protein [Pyrinomonadaceae bacterium]